VESIVISFAQKTFANGRLTSKLHVIELGAPAGEPILAYYVVSAAMKKYACSHLQNSQAFAHTSAS